MKYFRENNIHLLNQWGKNQKGFTLIELVVATGVFLVVITLSTGIFVMNNRTQQRTDRIQKLQADMGWVMEKIVNDIRFGFIDYSKMPDSMPMDYLALLDTSGNSIMYTLRSSSTCASPESTPCISMGVDLNKDGYIEEDDHEYSYLTSTNVKVKNLRFYVSPLNDPFTSINGVFSSSQQPQVTIIVSSESTQGVPLDITVQTTVVSRVYKR